MSNSNALFGDMIAKLQEVLNSFNCKAESRISDHDAMIFGKFSSYMEKYNVIIHISEENYKPVTASAGIIEERIKEQHEIRLIPSLELQQHKTNTANCSEKEQTEKRESFIKEMEVLGREFVQKWNK